MKRAVKGAAARGKRGASKLALLLIFVAIAAGAVELSAHGYGFESVNRIRAKAEELLAHWLR